jgi:hypothetical protein
MSHEALSYRAADTAALPKPRLATNLWQRIRRGPEAGNKAAETRANVRVAVGAMLIAFAIFALFGSADMRHAARNLPGNAVSDVMVDAADRWHAAMERLGPAKLRDIVRNAIDDFRMAQWPWH